MAFFVCCFCCSNWISPNLYHFLIVFRIQNVQLWTNKQRNPSFNDNDDDDDLKNEIESNFYYLSSIAFLIYYHHHALWIEWKLFSFLLATIYQTLSSCLSITKKEKKRKMFTCFFSCILLQCLFACYNNLNPLNFFHLWKKSNEKIDDDLYLIWMIENRSNQ